MKKYLGLILPALLLFAAPLFAQRTALFPRFASGTDGSGGKWKSEFFFTNQGISEVQNIEVSFFDQTGAAAPVVTNLGSNSSFTFDLAAGASQNIQITPSGSTLVEGHVEIDYPDFDSPVRASEVFRYELNGTVLVEVGMPQQEWGDHFSFPVTMNQTDRVFTAIALTNPTTAAQTFVVNLINTNGTLSSTATVPLAPGEHKAGYIDQAWLFPQLNNSNFSGSISVSSQKGAGVLTLRQDKDAFGAVSTDGGPVLLSSFLETGSTASDADSTTGFANDFFEDAQALSIPVRVSGSIGYFDPGPDWDFYAFNGQAGKILTVICDTTQVSGGSYADPIVGVYDSNYNEIALNDQNGLAPGLYPSNDSFVQVVLPYTGTYYITVNDFWEDVGNTADYKYYLHIKTR